MFTQFRQWVRSFLHDKLDWHTVAPGIESWKFDGFNVHKPIFVGVHPDYQRRKDVEIQTQLVRPEVKVVYSLEDLAQQVRKEA